MTPSPTSGGVAERSNATDCKSVGVTLRWFESSPLHQDFPLKLGQLVRPGADREGNPDAPIVTVAGNAWA